MITLAVIHKTDNVSKILVDTKQSREEIEFVLNNHYNELIKVERLIALGEIEFLSKNIGKKQKDFKKKSHWTIAKKRDFGTPLQVFSYDSLEEYQNNIDSSNYNYIFSEGKWFLQTGSLTFISININEFTGA